jgi:uncharacterized repeat protein (TIGR02543 family)
MVLQRHERRILKMLLLRMATSHRSAWSGGLILALAIASHAQESQFAFDANGNLLTESVATAAPPQILSQPQPQVVGPGELASFFVVVADARALTYQWHFNNANIIDATNETLLLTNVSAANEGPYSVVLVNPSGSVTSAPAMLMIDSDEDGLADSWELANFGSLNQNASGDFDSDGVSNLAEFQDGTSPTNSASALFRLTVLADSGTISIAPDQLSYTNGQTVTVTATELPGDHFQGWTGDAASTNNPLTLVMTNNRTVFAHFRARAYDIVWTNLAGGDWHQPLNWWPNLVPDADDTVWITNSVTVTVSGDGHCSNLNFGYSGAPTLTGAGALTIYDDALWTQGSMSGTGRTIIAPGGKFTMANAGNVTLNTRTLENTGIMSLTGVGEIILNNAVITNRPGALFQAQSATDLSNGGGTSRFDNAGTFRKSAGGTTTVSGIDFNNYGVVELVGGNLDLSGGGTHTGSFEVPAGRTLIFSGGTHTGTASSTIIGEGNLTTSGSGTTTLGGLVNLSGTHTFNSLAVNLTGNYICTNNTLVVSAGVATFNGTGLVTPNVLTLNGTLSGSNTVTVLNQMTWSSGGMSGSGRTIIPAGVTLTLNNLGSVNLNTRTLDNGGTVLWTGAGGISVTSAVITNRPGALFQAQSTADLSSGGVCRFDNAGTFRKSAGGTTTFFGSFSFNNYSAVELPGGSLDLRGGGTHSGSFDVPAGRTLVFSGGTHSATASSTITGEGNLTVTGSGTTTLAGLVNLGGTHTLGGLAVNLTGNYICTNNTLAIPSGVANFNGTGTVTPAVLTLNATLSGSNVVTVLSQMTWSGGGMSGSGRTIIRPGATLTISLGSVGLNTRTLDNGGTVLWTGAGGINLSSAVITNRPGALFQVQNATAFNFGGGVNRLDNAGTFRKISSGTTSVGSNIRFNNDGVVEIRRGILQANGGYTSSGAALLNSAIGGTTAGTGFGQLQVAGTVNLNGSLSVDVINGFAPGTNDTFAVLTAGTRNGTFANFLYPSDAVTMQLSNSPNAVIVRVTGLVDPTPILLQPQLAGSNVWLTWIATSNRTYRLEFNPDLNATNWNALAGDITATSNTVSRLDALTATNRFYRIRVVP